MFSKALDVDPSCADAHYLYATCISKQGDTLGAIASFSRAIELDPFNVAAYIKLATCWFKWNDYNKAANVLGKVESLDPGNAAAGKLNDLIAETSTELLGEEANKPSERELAMLEGREIELPEPVYVEDAGADAIADEILSALSGSGGKGRTPAAGAFVSE